MFGNHFPSKLGSLFFPACCTFCKQQIFHPATGPDSDGFENCCKACSQQLVGQPLDRCHKCGASTTSNNPFGEHCRLCHGVDLRFERAVAIGDYRGLLQQTLIQMKRTHDEVKALRFGHLLATQIDRFEVGIDAELIVPVPTHWLRKFKRGFHAASVIAEGVSQKLRIPRADDVLRCRHRTKKQGTLMNAGRFRNVQGAFQVRSNARIVDKQILIVDDVMTSGATAGEVAKTLLRAGAAQVYVAVAARGARVS